MGMGNSGEMPVLDQGAGSGLASIAGFDFEFDSAEIQGQYERFDFEYLDDNYEFSARYIGHDLRETWLRIGVALGALLSLGLSYLVLRFVGKSRLLSTFLATFLLFVSMAMVALWIFPILGLFILAASILWILKSWIPVGAPA